MKYVDYDILVINRKHYSFLSLQSMFLWLGGIIDDMIPLAKSDLIYESQHLIVFEYRKRRCTAWLILVKFDWVNT